MAFRSILFVMLAGFFSLQQAAPADEEFAVVDHYHPPKPTDDCFKTITTVVATSTIISKTSTVTCYTSKKPLPGCHSGRNPFQQELLHGSNGKQRINPSVLLGIETTAMPLMRSARAIKLLSKFSRRSDGDDDDDDAGSSGEVSSANTTSSLEQLSVPLLESSFGNLHHGGGSGHPGYYVEYSVDCDCTTRHYTDFAKFTSACVETITHPISYCTKTYTATYTFTKTDTVTSSTTLTCYPPYNPYPLCTEPCD